MTPEQELLDESAQRILNSLTTETETTTNNHEEEQDAPPRQLSVAGSIHDNTASENTASDSDGLQGGQNWTSYPTKSPSLQPTLSPTDSPTFQPTLRGIPKTVRGMMWYDANGNGVRDSNVVRGEFGDVEYKFGVGGVSMMLKECIGRPRCPLKDQSLEQPPNLLDMGPGVNP